VLADPRQVEHEGLFELEPDLVLRLAAHLLDKRVEVTELAGAAEVVVPVRRPGDLGVLTGDERLRPGDGEVVAERRLYEVLVVVGPRLVVVTELGLDRAGEDAEQLADPAPGLEGEVAAAVERPAATPLILVLVATRIPLPRAGFHVVEPHVLGSRAVGPGLLAGDGAGVAADALVEVHDHRHLSHDAHQ